MYILLSTLRFIVSYTGLIYAIEDCTLIVTKHDSIEKKHQMLSEKKIPEDKIIWIFPDFWINSIEQRAHMIKIIPNIKLTISKVKILWIDAFKRTNYWMNAQLAAKCL